MTNAMRRALTLSRLFFLSFCLGSAAQAAKEVPLPPHQERTSRPISFGDTVTISSRILSEPREINIYLPADYSTSNGRYPVLYLIDGGLDQDFLHITGAVHLGALWARSRSAIVVGIATKDRRRELTGETRKPDLLKRYPTAGSSSLFRAFIRNEVMPMIEEDYRVTDEKGVIGESLAGLFIVETFLREPELFDHYAAISPSLWWDDARLVADTEPLLAQRQRAVPPIYLSMANEGAETQAAMDRLTGALKSQKGWCYAPKLEMTHATIYHSVSPEALQFLFPHKEKPDPQSGLSVKCALGDTVR